MEERSICSWFWCFCLRGRQSTVGSERKAGKGDLWAPRLATWQENPKVSRLSWENGFSDNEVLVLEPEREEIHAAVGQQQGNGKSLSEEF